MSTIGMTNVQDTEPGPLLTEQDFEHLTRKAWPVEQYEYEPEPAERSRIADVIFATVFGALLGVSLAHWLAR